MALTQDQASMLETAISNLNKSVQVNQEVLEVVKSVGNTGAVDIATHNNDADAHPAFNTVFANNIVQVSGSLSDNWDSINGMIRLQAGNSMCFFDSYRNIDKVAQSVAFRNVSFKTDYSRLTSPSSAQAYLIFAAREMYKEGGSTKWQTLVHMNFSEDSEHGPHGFINLTNRDGYTNVRYNFWKTGFVCGIATDLGSSTFQWKDAYLQNSPIVSSDRRLKQDFDSVPEAVFKAWARVGFKQYRFKEAVEKKGAEARLHVGLIAQEILEAFEAEGLDATAYGIVCHDSWDNQYEYETVIDAEAVYDKDGKVVTPEKSHTEKRLAKAAGDVWTVRYEEALALETAYQRWRLSKIEAALAAKGITL